MSLHRLPEPCWILHNPHGWTDPNHPAALAHYTSRADAAADADALTDTGHGHDLDLIRPAQRCWELRCDRCGTCGDGDEGAIHLASRAEALEWAAEWRTDRTGAPALCPACALAEDCETYGHDWTPWRDCACRGTHRHHRHGCPQFRYCARCLTYQPAWPDTAEESA